MPISVVMAVFNGEEFLQEAIESILAQSYADLEIIIVNDASTDGTKEILRQFTDKRLKVIHLEENKGAAYALNLGIDQAKGEWIAIHDADDISYCNRIEEQVNYLTKHPNLVAVSSFIECIPGRKNLIKERSLKGLENFINRVQVSSDIKSELYTCCPLTHGTIIFSKKAFLAAGKYNPHLRVSYDFDLWTRLITLGPIEKVPKKLYKYRLHTDSLTNNNLMQTINESFFCCAKYIRHTCYKHKEKKPAMVIFGPKTEADPFALQAKSNLKVVKIIYPNQRTYLPKIITSLRQKELDGVIILSNYRYRRGVLKYLIKKGMELNKNLFEFWIWW